MSNAVIRVSGAGIFPHPHSMPHIGMSIEQAARFIRKDWQGYIKTKQCKAKEQEKPNPPEAEHNPLWCQAVTLTGDTSSWALGQTIRDCGWCVAHQGGDKALQQLHDLAIKGLDPDGDGYKLSRQIDYAFSGIAGWLA